jgi:hypothetical protein
MQTSQPYQDEEEATPIISRKPYFTSYGNKYSDAPKKKTQYLEYLRTKKSSKNTGKEAEIDPVLDSMDFGENLQVDGWDLTSSQRKMDDNNLAGDGIGNYGRYDIGIGGGGGFDDAPEGEMKKSNLKKKMLKLMNLHSEE